MKFVYTKQFQRDIKKAQGTLLIPKIERLIEIVRRNPFQTPPPYEKLRGLWKLVFEAYQRAASIGVYS